jgi:hypothetical protein
VVGHRSSLRSLFFVPSDGGGDGFERGADVGDLAGEAG